MKNWRDNKYGLEAGYSALNEAEDFKFGVKGWGLILVALACVGALLWWLLTA